MSALNEASVELTTAREGGAREAWLRNVYPFYLHDLSEFDGSYHLDELGRWQPDHLSYWLTQPFCHPLVVSIDGAAVGFALVGGPTFPYKSAEADFRLSELFILRSRRRSGAGAAVVSRLVSRFAGAWELSVLPSNRSALSFWRAVLPSVGVEALRESAPSADVLFEFVATPGSGGRRRP